ncbi:MAG: low molecular weight phosphatase family protein [Rhizobiales bacterium]|nr:low molecular weight phosphatase family protein [Hyphomicrobiales bacterium]
MTECKAGRPDANAPRSVLFVCAMNAIRSPMAAAITRTLYPHIIYSRSAGIHKGENDPFVKQVMNEFDIDISTHNPHTYEELDDGNFELVIALTPEAKDHVEEILRPQGTPVEFWPLPDPTLETAGRREQRLEAYRLLRDTLIVRIKNRFGWQESAKSASIG